MSRSTKQKAELDTLIDKQEGTFTAEDLETQSEASTATIYRHLARRRKQGTLHSYTCKGTRIHSTHKTSHAHFTCERCKTTKHLDIRELDFLDAISPGDICHVQIDITGTCKDCQRRKETRA